MSKIKYRSAHYNINDGKFSHFSYWGFIDHKGNHSEDCFSSPSIASATIRKYEEQLTGLEDRNGKDIYKGDIVQVDSYAITRSYADHESDGYNYSLYGAVKYMPSRGFYLHIYKRWDCDNDIEEKFSNKIGYITQSKSKIIGNIHQNPELIK